MCKIRISAHPLRVETDRYSKNYIERSLRKCQYCTLNKTEDELHFIIECPLYAEIRDIFSNKILHHCKNFNNLQNSLKFNWIFMQEDLDLLREFGNYVFQSLQLRRSSNIIV